jgi:hypothetical protein
MVPACYFTLVFQHIYSFRLVLEFTIALGYFQRADPRQGLGLHVTSLMSDDGRSDADSGDFQKKVRLDCRA